MNNAKQEKYQQINEEQKFSETDPFTEDRYRQFFRYLPANVKILLDVGCNTGRGGTILKQLNERLEIFGLDCLESRLENLPQDVYQRKICGYSTDIPIENSSIDAILAGEFIEHLYSEDVIQTLKEFYRLLKPKGQLLLTTPNPNYLRLKLTGGSVLGGAHVSQHEPIALKKQLEDNGFSNIKLCGSGKISRLINDKVPFLAMYGSYLAIAEKN